MLPTGELVVINVTQYDAQKAFRCRTLHSLTQDVVISNSVGRIQLTGENSFIYFHLIATAYSSSLNELLDFLFLSCILQCCFIRIIYNSIVIFILFLFFFLPCCLFLNIWSRNERACTTHNER